ncbi:hypothetical protein N7449_011163 [Penicillium cf. viridicatum]|uniref:Uncharacterized protein n=1 Tax=Penicillium cf. viridicatum TaxID=2972119 RepID=A0A9W9M2M3_9EURO|nr:hypothetical protein N7449_011163 [Penicillium cf. viridicatum]
MSDGVGESHRFPPIDGLHDRCCNISNERCRRAPLEFIKSPSPRCLSAKPASAFPSELSLHTYVLKLLKCEDFIPRELLVRRTDQASKPSPTMFFSFVIGKPTCSKQKTLRIATAHRPPTACSPTLLQTLCFVRTTGFKLSRISTGINRYQTGIECLIRAWSFPCSFLVFFCSIFLIPNLLSFLEFARLYFSIALSSLTQFFRNFLSLGTLCLAIAIVPRLVRGDPHSPPSPPLDCRLHPGFKTEEISPAYWHVSQSPRTSFLQSSLFQG